MNCPFCGGSSNVVETRSAGDANRRRRSCDECERRFTTYERIEGIELLVRKRGGSLEQFDPEKLQRGLTRAATKRPVTVEQLEQLVIQIEQQARSAGDEVSAARIGELALLGLRELDAVAYIRFASVYREFSNVAEFESELEQLAKPASTKRSKSGAPK